MTSHKLGEWRDDVRLDVTGPRERFGQIVGERRIRKDGTKDEIEEVLFVTYDGLSLGEQLMGAFDAGFRKGRAAGAAEARAEMREALGIGGGDTP